MLPRPKVMTHGFKARYVQIMVQAVNYVKL